MRAAAVAGIALALAACGTPPDRPAALPEPPQELPPWFADPAAGTRTIAGRVYVGQQPAEARVHLRIATDPAAWAGIEVTSGTDGAFDLGAWPPGPYLLLATAPGMTSRVVEVDTRPGAAADVELFLHPCKPSTGQLMDIIRPMDGVELSLGGVVLATTAADGTYSLCTADDPERAHVIHRRSRRWVPDRLEQTPSRAAVFGGVVRWPDGSPAVGVGVHANQDRPVSHGYLPTGLPEIATTDARGRFTLYGLPARHAWACIQFLDRGRLYTCKEREAVVPSMDLQLVIDPRRGLPDDDPRTSYVISGRVTRDGVGVPDAWVSERSLGSGRMSTRTDREGNFRLRLGGMMGPLDLWVAHADGSRRSRKLPAGRALDGVHIELRPPSPIADIATRTAAPRAEAGPLDQRAPGTVTIECDRQTFRKVQVWLGASERHGACGTELTGVPPGVWTAAAKNDRGDYALTTVRVESGERAVARLRVRPMVKVTGRAVAEKGSRPLGIVECRWATAVGAGIDVGDGPTVPSVGGAFAMTMPTGRSKIGCLEWSGDHLMGQIEVDLTGDTDGMLVPMPDAKLLP